MPPSPVLRTLLDPRLALGVLLAVLGLGGATGCATLLSAYDDQWQCPYAKGEGPCESVSRAYQRVASKESIPTPVDPTRYTAGLTTPSPAAPAGSAWVPPVKTVWIAPYVDTLGRRHEAQLLRLVVLPGRLAVRPEPEFTVPPVPETDTQGVQTGPPAPPPDTAAGNRTGRQTLPSRDRQQQPSRTRGSSNSSTTTQPSLGGFPIPGY